MSKRRSWKYSGPFGESPKGVDEPIYHKRESLYALRVPNDGSAKQLASKDAHSQKV